MKAAVMHEWEKFRIDDIPRPELKAGEALVKIRYTGICKSDIHFFEGAHPVAHTPMVVGHEFSGVVEALNPDASGTTLKPGDNVVGHITISCGRCAACISEHPTCCMDLKVLGSQLDGTFVEYLAIPIYKLYKIPDDADLRLYALAEPLSVGVYAVQASKLSIMETAVVIGGGPIGICCALAAEAGGASKVAIIEVVPERVKRLREEYGFTVISPDGGDTLEQAMAMTGGVGFNAVYETSGSKPGVASMTHLAAPKGRIVQVGLVMEPTEVDLWQVFRRELSITSIRVQSQPAFAAAVKMIESGKYNEKLYKMITNDYDFEELQEAFDFCMNNTDYCKVMVKVTD